jgi:hypothetical protein
MNELIKTNTTIENKCIASINELLNLQIRRDNYRFAQSYISKETGEDIINVYMEYDERLWEVVNYYNGNYDIFLHTHPKIITYGEILLEEEFLVINLNATIKYPKKYYDLYLATDKWRGFKNSIISKRGFNCELCSSKKNIQVHHLTYERLGNEMPEDVMILCKKCHEKAHFN